MMTLILYTSIAVLYACTEDMASGNPVSDWISKGNHSITDSFGLTSGTHTHYADDGWSTEEDYEVFAGNETEYDLGGLTGNHSETNKTMKAAMEHGIGSRQEEVEEQFQTVYSDENLHFQKKNDDFNLDIAHNPRDEEHERNMEHVNSEGTRSYVTTTTSFGNSTHVNITSSYEIGNYNNAVVQHSNQQTQLPSIHHDSVTHGPLNELQLENADRDSEGIVDIEREGRPSHESNDTQAGSVVHSEHDTFTGEQYSDFSMSNSSSDRSDVFDGNVDGIVDGSTERREHINSENDIGHHFLTEGENLTSASPLLSTEAQRNEVNNRDEIPISLSTQRSTSPETVAGEPKQLMPPTPSENTEETNIHDNKTIPTNLDLSEFSNEPIEPTTEPSHPSIVHSTEPSQFTLSETTDTHNSITSGTTTSSPSSSTGPESTQSLQKEQSTSSDVLDITLSTSDEHIIKPVSTPEIPTQQWTPASEDIVTTTSRTQATLVPPTLPLEPEPSIDITSTSSLDKFPMTTVNPELATDIPLEMSTETSGEVPPDIKVRNFTTSMPMDVSIVQPLETISPTSEFPTDNIHEKTSPITEKPTDFIYHPTSTVPSTTATSSTRDTSTTSSTGILSAVKPVPSEESGIGSVNCSDVPDRVDHQSSADIVKSPPLPSTYLILELAISWSVFCRSKDKIKSEIYGIMSNGTASLNIEQIHVYNTDRCQCTDTDQLIHVSLYMLNKTLIYDQDLTIRCGYTLKKFQGSNDNFVILNKLKGVIINGDPVKPVPVQNDDSNLLTDPGVTVAIVLAVVGGCCCIALISLQVIVRRRNKDQLTLKPSLKRSVSWSSDSIRLSAINKSRPNSGLYNPGLDLTDLTLPYRLPRLSVVPSGDEDKNRFANVLPLTQTRVKLLQDGPEPRGSYINANYITGPNNQCQYYIATQAPITSTVTDLWTMVWQQNSKAIVMLTQLEEDGQSKCVLYWPELVGKSAALKSGDFLIELKQKDVHQEYIVSKLEVHHLRKIEKREVYHFWYTCWPSHGLPEPISLVKLVLDIRPKYEDGTSPLIVHCSPGTGRTGTFIALDLCMRQFETMRIVDILKTVYLIRQERAGAVQSKEQYYLLYNAITEYATIVVSPVVSTASSATTLHALLSS